MSGYILYVSKKFTSTKQALQPDNTFPSVLAYESKEPGGRRVKCLGMEAMLEAEPTFNVDEVVGIPAATRGINYTLRKHLGKKRYDIRIYCNFFQMLLIYINISIIETSFFCQWWPISRRTSLLLSLRK